MFDAVAVIRGIAAPLPLANIDTDVIIRIERLTIGDPAMIGHWALEALRYLPESSANPDFILNRPGYAGAPILIAGPNFGCGSSREAAATALLAMGFRCVVAAEFGDIFYSNCFQNGLLPVRLGEAEVLALMAEAATPQHFEVDLVAQEIRTPDGAAVAFAIDRQRRENLLVGVDDIGLTLRDGDAISAWQTRDRLARPWVWCAGETDDSARRKTVGGVGRS